MKNARGCGGSTTQRLRNAGIRIIPISIPSLFDETKLNEVYYSIWGDVASDKWWLASFWERDRVGVRPSEIEAWVQVYWKDKKAAYGGKGNLSSLVF